MTSLWDADVVTYEGDSKHEYPGVYEEVVSSYLDDFNQSGSDRQGEQKGDRELFNHIFYEESNGLKITQRVCNHQVLVCCLRSC